MEHTDCVENAVS